MYINNINSYSELIEDGECTLNSKVSCDKFVKDNMSQNQIHAIINEPLVIKKKKRKSNRGKQEKELNRLIEEEERELATELYDRKFMNYDLVVYKIEDNGKPIYQDK